VIFVSRGCRTVAAVNATHVITSLLHLYVGTTAEYADRYSVGAAVTKKCPEESSVFKVIKHHQVYSREV